MGDRLVAHQHRIDELLPWNWRPNNRRSSMTDVSGMDAYSRATFPHWAVARSGFFRVQIGDIVGYRASRSASVVKERPLRAAQWGE